MPNRVASVLIAACAAATWTTAASAAESWFLMARHGECADVASLARKVPDIGDIRDPLRFIEFMRGKGYEVSFRRTQMPEAEVYEVNVPAQGLALLFIPDSLCVGPVLEGPQ